MNTDNVTDNKGNGSKGKGLKALLFFANWLFVVFMGKKFIDSPAGSLDFVAENIATFLVALVVTALIIHFCPRKAIIVMIPIMVILALAIAVI